MKKSYKEIKVNRKWIKKNLVWKDWNRTIYSSKVNKLAGKIKTGKFIPEVPIITVGNQGNGFNIIDGQHTIRAIEKEDAEFKIDFRIFSDITEDEMISMYEAINDVKPFRLVDDIKMYVGRHYWLDAFFDKSFPIAITLHGGINALKLGDVFIVLYGGLRTNKFRTSFTRLKLPLFLEDLDEEKFSLMKEFCALYLKCFSFPHRDNWLYKNTIMTTLMKIWYKNKEDFTEEEFIKRFRPIERVSSIRQISSASGFDKTAFEIVLPQLYKEINKGYSKSKMKKYWEED